MRIIVVADHPSWGQSLARRVSACGHQVVGVVVSGQVASAQATPGAADLVLLDLRRESRIDEATVAKAVRYIASLPIVLVTIEHAWRSAIGTLPHASLAYPFGASQLSAAIDIAFYKHASNEVLRICRQDLSETIERLRQAEARLAQAAHFTAIGELAASIAHELNQPLTAAVTNASACLRWLSHPNADLHEARQAAERIVQDGKRASAVIQTMRAVNRAAPSESVAFGFRPAVDEVLSLARATASQYGVLLKVTMRNDLPHVIGDRAQLQQVMLNLMLNGIEAQADKIPDAIVEIAAEEGPGERLIVRVSDGGPGIDGAHLDRIFEPLFTTKPDGLGLGLSICRTIVTAHGGQLSARPRAPVGSVFQFDLPALIEDYAHA